MDTAWEVSIVIVGSIFSIISTILVLFISRLVRSLDAHAKQLQDAEKEVAGLKSLVQYFNEQQKDSRKAQEEKNDMYNQRLNNHSKKIEGQQLDLVKIKMKVKID